MAAVSEVDIPERLDRNLDMGEMRLVLGGMGLPDLNVWQTLVRVETGEISPWINSPVKRRFERGLAMGMLGLGGNWAIARMAAEIEQISSGAAGLFKLKVGFLGSKGGNDVEITKN